MFANFKGEKNLSLSISTPGFFAKELLKSFPLPKILPMTCLDQTKEHTLP